MIRVARGPEPSELRRSRRWRLARAEIAVAEARTPETASGYRLGGVVKAQLVELPGEVCAFCEMEIYKEGSPVEHFRPRTHYWWLTWTWENLLLACGRCNGLKLHFFPLEDAAARASGPEDDLATEQPLLVDPVGDDPREHIRFRLSERDGRLTAKAFAASIPGRGRSKRGAKTIEWLKLDQNDHLNEHVSDLLSDVVDLQSFMATGQQNEVRKCWQRLLTKYLRKGRPFRSATWDVLAQVVPAEERALWGLESLPSLGDEPVFPPSVELPDPPGMDTLPPDLARQVRALLCRAPWDEREPVLRAIFALRDFSAAELAELFECKLATARHWKRRLAGGAAPGPPG